MSYIFNALGLPPGKAAALRKFEGNILGNTYPFLTIGGPNHFSRRFAAVIEALNLDSMADAHATADCCWEEHGYRTLINNELRRQERPITFLVKPLGRSRSYVSRVLSGQNKLTQELRERAFTALGIDPIRANIAVAWLRDVGRYHAMEVQHISDYFREYLVEVISVRQGCIKLVVKPAILREAAKRTIDTIMKHQERVFENETHLLD